MKAFDRANTFNYAEICDPPAQERKLRAWLVRIVANLVNIQAKTWCVHFWIS